MTNDRRVSQMVTAQWLRGGGSIYRTPAAGWSERFADGAIHADQGAADAALAAVQQDVRDRLVVSPYLIEVEVGSAGPEPTSARERIRAAHGTTFPVDHGSWSPGAAQGRQEQH